MLRLLRRNARIAWLCPEIRWNIARSYGCHMLAVLAKVPALCLMTIAGPLYVLANLVEAFARIFWRVTGGAAERKKAALIKEAHAILPVESIRSRLGESEPRILTGDEMLAQIREEGGE